LTLISTTLGTPYEIDTRGAILFLEDVDEEPYSIDRMLTHLRLAGKFDNVAGVIFGKCADCRPSDYKPSTASPYTLGETLDNILGNLRVPVLYGLAIGHTDHQLTLPLGVRATLDANAGTLDIKEAGVR
jgi:muramoyltetrapeptide carboxypeptidase